MEFDGGALTRGETAANEAAMLHFEPDLGRAKAAEFLLYGAFPLLLVERIGVQSITVGQQVTRMIAAGTHHPTVQILREWYF
jgi:hypothetical protein